MMLEVAELRRRSPAGKLQYLARFILTPQDRIEVIDLSPDGRATSLSLIGPGIPGPGNTRLTLEDGREFLEYLHQAFRGGRIFATEIFQMDDISAYTPP